MARSRRGPGDPPPAPKKPPDLVGTCPFCGRSIAVNPATVSLAIHGYKRPGRGVAVGRCLGTGEVPCEVSPDGLRRAEELYAGDLAKLEASMAGVEARLAALNSVPVLERNFTEIHKVEQDGWPIRAAIRDLVPDLKRVRAALEAWAPAPLSGPRAEEFEQWRATAPEARRLEQRAGKNVRIEEDVRAINQAIRRARPPESKMPARATPARATPGSLADRVFRSHLGQLDALIKRRGTAGLDALYKDARAELVLRLSKFRGDDDRVEPASLRAMLAQVDAVLERMSTGLERHLRDLGTAAAEMGAAHGARELAILEKHFAGTEPVVDLEAPAVLRGWVAGVEPSLVRRYSIRAKTWSLSQADQVERTVGVGIMTGKSVDRVVDDLQGSLETERWRAERIARTECLFGDARIDAVVLAASRRWYEGDVVEVVTEAGRHFTATPNHPVLTTRGWIGAGGLNDRDDLICCLRRENSSASRNEHVARAPTTIGEVFDTLAAIGIRERRRGTEPDFHGDGREGEIDVASPDGPLHVGSFAPLTKESFEQGLAPTDAIGGPRFCARCGALWLVSDRCGSCDSSPADSTGLDHAPDDARIDSQVACYGDGALVRDVSSRDVIGVEVVAETRRSTAALIKHRDTLAPISDADSFSLEDLRDPSLVRTDALSDLGKRKSGEVQLDRVIRVRRYSSVGHVYNVLSPNGYYAIDGAIVGNCAYAHGAAKNEAIKGAQELLDRPLSKKLIETFDDRTGDDSFVIHGQVVPADGLFSWKRKSRGGWIAQSFAHPPNRPHDRAVVIPWDPEWDEDELTRPLSGDELAGAEPTRWRKTAGVEVPPGHVPGRPDR